MSSTVQDVRPLAPGARVAFVGACATDEALRQMLAELGPDGEVVVLVPSASRLEELERTLADPRVWYMLGGHGILPLPDGYVDRVVGPPGEPTDAERRRVSRA